MRHSSLTFLSLLMLVALACFAHKNHEHATNNEPHATIRTPKILIPNTSGYTP